MKHLAILRPREWGSIVTFFSFLFCFASLGWAQVANLALVKSPNTWHEKPMANDAATVFESNAEIVEMHIDSLNGFVYLLALEGSKDYSGWLACLDTKGSKVRWSIPFDFQKLKFHLADSVPIIGSKSKTVGLNRKDGAAVWEVQKEMQLVSPDGQIAVVKGYGSNELFGQNTQTGQEVWKAPKLGNLLFLSADMIGDSAVLFVGERLEYLNHQTGNGFIYKPHMRLIEPVINSNRMGASFGFLGAVVVALAGSSRADRAKRKTGNSLINRCFDEGGIYIYGSKRLVKLNTQGEELWSMYNPLNEKILAKCFLFDDHVYSLNFGKLMIGFSVIYDNIHFTKTNTQTGKIAAYSEIKKEKRNTSGTLLLGIPRSLLSSIGEFVN